MKKMKLLMVAVLASMWMGVPNAMDVDSLKAAVIAEKSKEFEQRKDCLEKWGQELREKTKEERDYKDSLSNQLQKRKSEIANSHSGYQNLLNEIQEISEQWEMEPDNYDLRQAYFEKRAEHKKVEDEMFNVPEIHDLKQKLNDCESNIEAIRKNIMKDDLQCASLL